MEAKYWPNVGRSAARQVAVFGPQTREMTHAVDTGRLGDSGASLAPATPGLEPLISARSTLTLLESRMNSRSHLLVGRW